MGLTPEQIKSLIDQANKPKTRGRKPKNYIDTSIRDVVTWFKLGGKLMNEETGDPAKCSNPDCTDHRDKGQMVVHINGVDMCRRCFLDEFHMEPELDEVAVNDGN